MEIEHVDVATLDKLEQQGVDCQPKASTIRIIQVYNLCSQYLYYLLILYKNLMILVFFIHEIGNYFCCTRYLLFYPF